MDKKIILASTSPRRKMLLEGIGLDFEIMPSGYEEDMTLDMEPNELAEFLSVGKAKDIAEKTNNAIIIAADTIVVHDNKVLGKPKDKINARETLKKLSNGEHQVITGLTVIDTEKDTIVSRAEVTRVFFRELSEEEIDNYINTGEPLDKAGSYGIQELGATIVERIDGDYFNVVGLPVCRLAKILKQLGVKIL